MLRYLRVTNFAILSDVSMELGAGLNVLTGETGAGKSLIVDAVNLLRGGRASADIPRNGAEEAVVEAIFEPPPDLMPVVERLLSEAGLGASESGEVVVRRVIQREGRSRTYVNGALSTAARLAQLGAVLVDLSGQHEHQGLSDHHRHLDILDSFAETMPARQAFSEKFAGFAEIKRALDAERTADKDKRERIEFLRFQLEELESAALEEGEDERLIQEKSRLANWEKLAHGVSVVEELLYSGQEAACTMVGRAREQLTKLASFAPDFQPMAAALVDARVLMEDVARDLRSFAEKLDHNPERLAEVDDRLALISRLKRKHATDVAGLIERKASLAQELLHFDTQDERIKALTQQLAQKEQEVQKLAAGLRSQRRAAADNLCESVHQALAELSMGGARLQVHMTDKELAIDGGDKVEFLLMANRGEIAKPLAKIASGGELSRIMLALKLVLRRADQVGTYVFDEVDTGVGGATADVVGRQIHAVAKTRQVLCVTHLPQIAVFGDRHFVVSKRDHLGRTETDVHHVTGAELRDEVARMVGGANLTKEAKAHAEALLKQAQINVSRGSGKASKRPRA